MLIINGNYSNFFTTVWSKRQQAIKATSQNGDTKRLQKTKLA